MASEAALVNMLAFWQGSNQKTGGAVFVDLDKSTDAEDKDAYYEVALANMVAFWKDPSSADTDDSTATAAATTITATHAQTIHSNTGTGAHAKNEAYAERRGNDSITIATDATHAGNAELTTSADAARDTLSLPTTFRPTGATESAHAAAAVLAASKVRTEALRTAKPRTTASITAATAAATTYQHTTTRQDLAPVLRMGGPPSEIHGTASSPCMRTEGSAKPEQQSEYHAAGVAEQPLARYSAAWDPLGAVDSATSTSTKATNTSTFGVDCPALLDAGSSHQPGGARTSNSLGKKEGKAASTVGSWQELETCLNKMTAHASPSTPRASRAAPEATCSATSIHQDICDRYAMPWRKPSPYITPPCLLPQINVHGICTLPPIGNLVCFWPSTGGSDRTRSYETVAIADTGNGNALGTLYALFLCGMSYLNIL